jgi:hypothetical protein
VRGGAPYRTPSTNRYDECLKALVVGRVDFVVIRQAGCTTGGP